jgi:hypothetical protein
MGNFTTHISLSFSTLNYDGKMSVALMYQQYYASDGEIRIQMYTSFLPSFYQLTAYALIRLIIIDHRNAGGSLRVHTVLPFITLSV